MHHAHFSCFNFLKFFIRRYYYYLIIGIAITLLQMFWGYYVLYIGIDTKEISISAGTGKKPLLYVSQPINPFLNKRSSTKDIKNSAESLAQNYALNKGSPYECTIHDKDALSALRRVKTEECRHQIISLACQTEIQNFYAKRLSNRCPSNGNFMGRRLGCYIDDINNRILKGFNTHLINNHPNLCADICLQRGYLYAGVEFSKQCFCGNDEFSVQLRVPDKECDMKCSGDMTNLNCGGKLRINILNTGLAKVVPNTLSEVSNSSGPEVRIAFLLTVNGRSVRQIHRLIKALYSKSHFFFIHVDSRQNYLYSELLKLEKLFSNIVLSRQRLSSIWGGASLLTVLLNSMTSLIRKSDWPWDFVINLSESDYPIKKVSDLTKFLTANRDRNFLKSHGQNTNSFLKKQALDRTFLECEEHMWRIGKRKLPLGIRLDGGSDWICLGRKFVEYVVTSQDNLVIELKKIFTFTLLSAESFFHTVLRNSEMCHTFTDNNLHLTNWNRKLGCRCQYKDVVDWCGCSPNDFVKADWPKIQAIGKRHLYFGRKFEPVKSLSIINKLDESLHGRYQAGTAALNTHWENHYHIVDHPSGRSDAQLSLYHSIARVGVNSVNRCDAHLINIVEAHTLHINDIYRGIIIKYNANINHRNITKEVHMIKKSQFIKYAQQPLAVHIKDFQINSNFDLKEQMFRNFEEALGPQTKLTAAFWLNELTNNFNITLVLVDPLGIIATNQIIPIDKKQQQITYQLSFKTSLRVGIWSAYVIIDNNILARQNFVILPLLFSNGRRISEKQERYPNITYEPSYEVEGKDYSSLIHSEESQIQTNHFNDQLLKETDQVLCDFITKRLYELTGICFVDEKSVPSCITNPAKCANTHWSSLSPDPKSSFV